VTDEGAKPKGRGLRLGRSGTVELIGLAAMGVFLAAIAAFDSGDIPTLSRYLYWQFAMIGGGVIAAALEPLAARLTPGRPRVFAAAQLVFMTPPIILWVALLPTLLWGDPFRASKLVWALPSVVTVNIAVIVLAWVVRAAFRPAPRPATEGTAPEAIRARLSPRLARSRLIAVEAEDHYLRIRTEAGSELILMRLGDALEALSACDGFRTHRSWWVSRTGVETARWKGGRGELVLADGATAPVSRTYAATLKATDWAAPVMVRA
jgi:hypothetical protein